MRWYLQSAKVSWVVHLFSKTSKDIAGLLFVPVQFERCGEDTGKQASTPGGLQGSAGRKKS